MLTGSQASVIFLSFSFFGSMFFPPCPHPDLLVVLVQGQRGRLSSQPAPDNSGQVRAMEEGDAEGEGPVVVREGPSDRSLPSDASNTTTTNLLASVKEQVRFTTHTLVQEAATLRADYETVGLWAQTPPPSLLPPPPPD